MKKIKYFFIIILVTSCAITNKNYSLKEDFLSFVSSTKEESPNIEKFKVNIKHLNYTVQQEKKLLESASLLEKIFNSLEYKNEVINFTYKNEKKFHENLGKTNLEIYEHLMLGSEILMPVIDREMDLTVKMYYSFRSTVGYTYPNIMTVYTNRRFHNGFTPCQIASNLAHEWTHKMGYGHSKRWNYDRDFTVPYGHNKIIEKLCPLALENKLTSN